MFVTLVYSQNTVNYKLFHVLLYHNFVRYFGTISQKFIYFFLSARSKKKERTAVEFFKLNHKTLYQFQFKDVLNLPQNKFHKNNLKTEKYHNKFSSQTFVRTSQRTSFMYLSHGNLTTHIAIPGVIQGG